MYFPYQYYNPRTNYDWRQQPIRGQASWTTGGSVTQCNIPWSDNEFLTVAVSPNSLYTCGQTLKVDYPQTGREVLVEVVDTVPGYPPNKINLHQKAFEALGANPDMGIINVMITPSPELEQEQFGRYLVEVAQVAYPMYRVVDYQFLGREEVASNRVKESYEFTLASPQERIKVRGNVIYNPQTNRVISFDLNEVES
ncbi:DUF3889 domain-containing protein [Halalkalibacillus sediminis]|uniref:DUF3889 domain-containing protein n=1 Tax=Halalkalibacillus sediminis TaxID=2018042 RepID=A0A2I0QS74_9BACI|nr:DUF3889 domain-containing protein [Halalkalibacillus sediminis]PKR77159.1 DUF3889 domain-containing protein [Halalkalibacillus sediminis]